MKKIRIDLLTRTFLATTVCFLIAACGGGGGGSDPLPASNIVSITPSTPAAGSITPSTSVTTPSSSTTPVVTTPAIASCAPIKSAQEALNAVNAARAVARSCGSTSYPAVAPLQWNSQLAEAALAHSRDMATRNYFAHTNLDGETPSDRTAKAGYGRFTGENIAAGYGTLEAVMQGWLSSPGHCANIMRASYKDFALACAIPVSNNATYNIYWTQSFGAK
ncbi:CAP domain-containing protein [Variovorax sp. PCZ-1]|uniref:CAP domain-containing protein n=1 Tax=Variovorax sp. PCZ-1 TaxID=2835533 RepID=UPI001BCC0E29|nr:CAP domain-containing protein [Variovorax sp. PCZ-1]MBS7806857.1 CAP domain-containing protein [Variovorax sp. PCZ-1]